MAEELGTCGTCVYYEAQHPRQWAGGGGGTEGWCLYDPPTNSGRPRTYSTSWCGKYLMCCQSGCTRAQQMGYERGMGGRKICDHGI